MHRALILSLCLLAAPLDAGELAGVVMDDRVQAEGHALDLNGLGVLKKSIVKVYVGGLYLPSRQCQERPS